MKKLLQIYFTTGLVITLAQVTLAWIAADATTSAPAQHLLWKRFTLPESSGLGLIDSGPRWNVVTVAWGLTCWLPDHVSYLLSGKGSLRGYLMGGVPRELPAKVPAKALWMPRQPSLPMDWPALGEPEAGGFERKLHSWELLKVPPSELEKGDKR